MLKWSSRVTLPNMMTGDMGGNWREEMDKRDKCTDYHTKS
jgi:hypothetical protein